MPKGTIPHDYWCQPISDKPIEGIYRDLDGFTREIFPDEPELLSNLQCHIVLAPLKYEGMVLKGIMVSNAPDVVLERFPEISQIAFMIATSSWISYPWSKLSDGYFVCYGNRKREEWFRKEHPDRGQKLLIDAGDANLIDEYAIAPVQTLKGRDLELLSVARLEPRHNLPLIAEAIKICREKHSRSFRWTLVLPNQFDLNWKGLEESEKDELRKVQKVLGHLSDYIDFVLNPSLDDLKMLYSRARLAICGQLIGSIPRAAAEANSCNTPVVYFKDFDLHARQDADLAGICGFPSSFDAESLADVLNEALKEWPQKKSRKEILRNFGRRNLVNRCIDAIPYYSAKLPGYTPGEHHLNEWIDLATQDNYQLGYHDFIHDKNTAVSYRVGPEKLDMTMNFYLQRFGLRKVE